jgi:glycosyltransferase 2 family protein
MTEDHKKILSVLNFKRILIPIILGLGVAGYLLFQSFDKEVFVNIHWVWYSYLWLFLAICLMAVRDIAYMYRIRLLTDKQLSWRRSFQVIMLWEFASSVTPSVVGGSAVALFIVNKEGINMGRTTAIVMITAFLDEMFYILMVPVIIILVGYKSLFITDANFAIFNSKFGTLGIFLIGYVFILILTSIIIYGVFINPRGFKWILIKIFKLKFLRKWLPKAVETGDQIITTSKEMKGKPFIFWVKAYVATLFSWTARYWVVNCMILAFVAVDEHLLIYARQLIMWVILLISPTPGGSGVAEFVFSDFLRQFIPLGLAPALALLWRIISFYPYLFIGAIILPGWLNRVYSKAKKV